MEQVFHMLNPVKLIILIRARIFFFFWYRVKSPKNAVWVVPKLRNKSVQVCQIILVGGKKFFSGLQSQNYQKMRCYHCPFRPGAYLIDHSSRMLEISIRFPPQPEGNLSSLLLGLGREPPQRLVTVFYLLYK